jgi:hypothetical protein
MTTEQETIYNELAINGLPDVLSNLILEYTEIGYLATCGCAPLRTYDEAGRKLIVEDNVPLSDMPATIMYTQDRDILELMSLVHEHPHKKQVRIIKLKTPSVYARSRRGKKTLPGAAPVAPVPCAQHKTSPNFEFILYMEGTPMLQFVHNLGKSKTKMTVEKLGNLHPWLTQLRLY